MIYFVEDDTNIRKLVCYALSREGYTVCDFERPEDFWEALKKTSDAPDLFLLDIMLPGEDGLHILNSLQNDIKYKNTPVIMLTAKNSEFDTVTGLDMGADDYISKPFGMTELIARIRSVLRRAGKTKNNAEYRVANLYVNASKHIIEVDGEEINLSYKEYSLLMALLEAEGNVVRRDELLNKVWGEFYDDSRTLDVHIRKLRVKLKSAGEMIQTVKNIGYKLWRDEND